MEMQIKINYRWSRDDGGEIPTGHREALAEDAMDRIKQMITEGYTSGQLITTVRFGQDVVPEEDVEDGLEYSGWWDLDTETLS